MHSERNNFKSHKVKRLKECALALSKMSNTRASKPSAKDSDCVTDAESDSIIRNQSKQGDGKTSNVTFKTNELEKWKKCCCKLFCEDKTHVDNVKVGLCVMKVN